jgi:hypothetical protein
MIAIRDRRPTMNIPVLLEPISTGFRASTGAPLNLTAEAPTADEALAGIRGAWQAKEAAGGRVVSLPLSGSDPLLEAVRQLAAYPDILDQVDAGAKEYRRQREAEEEAAEAAEEARKKAAAMQEPAA